VQSVERAIMLINRVAEASPRGETVANLAAQCGINRATAWRLLATMEAHGLVEREPSSNRYLIGFAVARLAASSGVDGLVRRTHHIVERVSHQTGETAALAVAGRHGVTYVDEVAPPSVLAANWLAREVPLHATSTGKCFLAWLPDRELASLLHDPLQAFTETTIVDAGLLAAELKLTRERGYGVCAGELEPNLYGVSAPALSRGGIRPFAVFSIWGPADRVPTSRFAELGAVAVEAAAAVESVVGE
jgi:DNA-binding IclR family transcriptional regulator